MGKQISRKGNPAFLFYLILTCPREEFGLGCGFGIGSGWCRQSLVSSEKPLNLLSWALIREFCRVSSAICPSRSPFWNNSSAVLFFLVSPGQDRPIFSRELSKSSSAGGTGCLWEMRQFSSVVLCVLREEGVLLSLHGSLSVFSGDWEMAVNTTKKK